MKKIICQVQSGRYVVVSSNGGSMAVVRLEKGYAGATPFDWDDAQAVSGALPMMGLPGPYALEDAE